MRRKLTYAGARADGIAEREAADNSYASDYVSAAYASAYAAALNGTYEHHADLRL